MMAAEPSVKVQVAEPVGREAWRVDVHDYRVFIDLGSASVVGARVEVRARRTAGEDFAFAVARPVEIRREQGRRQEEGDREQWYPFHGRVLHVGAAGTAGKSETAEGGAGGM
jgi:hypothetical protein